MADGIASKIFLVLLLLLTSCAFQTTSINKRLTTAKKSFIHVRVFLQEEGCDLASCSEEMIPYSSASGVVVLYKKRKHVLTAAHVCVANNAILGTQEIKGYDARFTLIDRYSRQHIGKVVKIDPSIDTCLIYAEELSSPALRVATKKPEYGEKVYNIAAPLSIIFRNMVLVFEGLYSGEIGRKAYYTLPAIFGSSGSPILNSNGELIGLLHSVHSEFHHVSLSPTYPELWNFLIPLPSNTAFNSDQFF